MSIAAGPPTGRTARANRALNPDELRAKLSAAVERFDYHMREAQDLGRMNRTVDSLEHLGLANTAAQEAEALADQITALGNARTSNNSQRSSWTVPK